MTDLDVVASREDVLAALIDGPIDKRDLTDRLDASRSTVDRAVRELADAGLARRRTGGYVATLVGRLALDCFRAYRREARTLFGASRALDPLPADCDLPLEFVGTAEMEVASDPAPYRPMKRVHDAIGAADEFRILLPVLYDSRFLERCYEHAVEEGNPTSLVVDESVVETALEDFPEQTRAKTECDWFSVRTGETPTYGLLLTTRDGETEATAIVFGPSMGPVHAVLRTDDPAAVRWAEERFERCLEAATAPDGGDATADRGVADGGRNAP